jgi:hypothetical protein
MAFNGITLVPSLAKTNQLVQTLSVGHPDSMAIMYAHFRSSKDEAEVIRLITLKTFELHGLSVHPVTDQRTNGLRDFTD